MISVIVPVYNVDKYLEKCVDSILEQTYVDLEVILVDDGSTDMSGNICDNYAKIDSRVKVLHQQNKGLSAARNIGLNLANGEWVAFVDSDDWIELNMFENMLMLGLEHDAELVLGKFKVIDQNNKCELIKDTCEVTVFNGTDLITEYIQKNTACSITPSVWDRLYRKDLIWDLCFPEGRLHEDICFTVDVFCRCKRAVYVDSSFYNYRTSRRNSISNSTYTINRIEDTIILSELAERHLIQRNFKLLAQEFYMELYGLLADICIQIDDKCIRHYIKEYRRCNIKKTLQICLNKNIKLKKRILVFLQVLSPWLKKYIVDIYSSINIRIKMRMCL